MNRLEKFITWFFGWKYCEKEEVTVEIIHLHSWHKKVEALQKSYTYNFSKFPLKVVRPKSGKTRSTHNCPYCKKQLVIKAVSRASLKKIINISGWILGIASIMTILSLILFGNKLTALAAVSMILVILSFTLLALVLPMEYKQKGISLGFGEAPAHTINYSIDPNTPI